MRPSDDALAPDAAGSTPTDILASTGGEGPRRFGPLSRWQGAALALLTGALVIGACEGDNLWSGNSESAQPKVVGIVAPSPVYPGDTIQVQVSAYGSRQIASIQLSLGGAVTRDTSVTIASPSASVVASVSLALPNFFTDTLLLIRAVAYDKTGAASRMRSDTSTAVAPPAVADFSGPDSVRAGQPLALSVHAVGVRPITKVHVWLKSALSAHDSIMVLQPRRDVTESITFPAPSVQFNDTSVTVDLQAVDNTGVSGYITRGRLPVAIPAPSIDSVWLPMSGTAGVPVQLTVKARSLRTVTQLAIRMSGAINTDSIFKVTNPAKVVIQNVSIMIPQTSQDSILRMSIRAIDAAAIMGTSADTAVRLAVGTPVVDALSAPDSIRSGTTLDARVNAHGPRFITKVTLQLRGAYNTDVTAVPNPASNNITYDFSVPLGTSASDSLLVVRAFVTDVSGAVSAIVQKTVRISDTAPPTMTASLLQTSIAAGRSLGVKIKATDNVGLASLGVRLLNAANNVISSASLAVTGRSQDTTVYVSVPLMGPTRLNAIASATDRFNNQALSNPMQVAVVDSSIPTSTILSPDSGTTYPLNDSVLVQVRAASLVGVKNIALSGIAYRGGGTSNVTTVNRFTTNTVTFPQPPSTRLPHDTTISRWLKAIPDTTSEFVYLIAQVTDSANMTAFDTVRISVGGPLVQILTPAAGASVSVNQPFQVRVYARDKSAGLDSVIITTTGALATTFASGALSGVDTVTIQQNFTPTVTGPMTIGAVAYNRRGIIGRATQVSINVASVGTTTDTQRPSVQIASIQYKGQPLADFTRVELTDTIAVLVKALDNGGSGVRRVGVTVSAVPGSTVPGLVPLGLQMKYVPAQAGEVAYSFNIVPRNFGLTEAASLLSKTMNVQLLFTAFAQDAAAPTSYCGATVQLAVYDSVPCAYAFNNGAVPPDSFFTATGRTPYSKSITLVGGRTVTLPNGGQISDEVVDAPHMQLYLSNIQQNKIDVLRLNDTTFVNTGSSTGLGLVGSQPWGIFLNGTGDSLFVANSGSTNLSVMVVNPASPNNLREDLARRLFTPNEVLWQVQTAINNGFVRYTATYLDFSDRPQFVAQDANGRLVYSTVPTPSAADGTLRYVIPSALAMEPKLLFNSKAIDPNPSDFTSIAFMDSMVVVRGALGGNDGVSLCDHEVGYPNDPTHVFCSPVMDLQPAVAWMRAHVPPSDLVAYAGKWIPAKIGMSDTTFMAASGDRKWIAFGEGAASPAGRIMMWDGSQPATFGISSDVSVTDLINNASEKVFGLGLNANGTLGVARGLFGAYYFTPQLRLQGLYQAAGGAGGAALHPLNSSVTDATYPLSFVATPTKSIQIVDAVHFYQRGEIQLRDQVVGPVKAGLALPGENAGLAAGDPNYIVAKLYCVTANANGQTQVVMVNVRNKDVTN